MINIGPLARIAGAATCVLAICLPHPAVARGDLSPAEIIQKAVERNQPSNTPVARPDYCYLQRTVIDELDGKGALKSRNEKVEEIRVRNGLAYVRLIQSNGKPLSAAERKKREERELAERQKMTGAKTSKKGDDREHFLTSELIERYRFTLVGVKAVNGRDAYLLTFEPRDSKLPVKQLTDRVLNQIAGKIWVDVEEFEIARAEVHLLKEVTLWGGVLGSLRQSDFTFERTRLPDGAWFSHFSHGQFEGRKLLDAMRYRTRSENSNFKRLDAVAE